MRSKGPPARGQRQPMATSFDSERVDELADVGDVDLVIGGQRDDGLAGGLLEAGHQGRGFAELAGEADHGEVLARAQAAARSAAANARLRAVQHEDQLVVLAQGVEPGLVFGVQLGRVRLPRPDRHDDGDRTSDDSAHA